jgi:hypothetical protein
MFLFINLRHIKHRKMLNQILIKIQKV